MTMAAMVPPLRPWEGELLILGRSFVSFKQAMFLWILGARSYDGGTYAEAPETDVTLMEPTASRRLSTLVIVS